MKLRRNTDKADSSARLRGCARVVTPLPCQCLHRIVTGKDYFLLCLYSHSTTVAENFLDNLAVLNIKEYYLEFTCFFWHFSFISLHYWYVGNA